MVASAVPLGRGLQAFVSVFVLAVGEGVEQAYEQVEPVFEATVEVEQTYEQYGMEVVDGMGRLVDVGAAVVLVLVRKVEFWDERDDVEVDRDEMVFEDCAWLVVVAETGTVVVVFVEDCCLIDDVVGKVVVRCRVDDEFVEWTEVDVGT